ncbi:MAG: FAD-dependent oxidoreductase [bacterium]|nr:FAD-dependent oxidoreductase [bacterium]
MSEPGVFAVVGGGASGVAAAWLLRRHGLETELIERQENLGGRIGCCRLGDRVVDFGGKNIGKGYRLFRRFTAEMGDNPYEAFGLNSCRIDNGKLLRFDARSRWRNAASFLSRCSPRDGWRFLRMLAAVKWNDDNGYLGGSYFSALDDRLPARKVSDFFGRRFCELVMRPLAVRTNGAEPDEIFLGNLGSNLRMILDSYEQLTNGMGPLFEQFTAGGPVRFGSEVRGLIVRRGRVCGLRIRGPQGDEERPYAGVVLATPASVSAEISAESAPDLAETLRQVRYFPVTIIIAEYQKPIFNHDVRALVFGSDCALSNAGVYGINDMNILRYTFSGCRARELMQELGTDELLRYGEENLSRYVAVSSELRVRFAARHFRNGLCAFAPRHAPFVQSLESTLDRLPGLYLTGDYLQGASIEACFRAAQRCCDRIATTNGRAAG